MDQGIAIVIGALIGGSVSGIVAYFTSRSNLKAVNLSFVTQSNSLKAKFDIEVNFAFIKHWYNFAFESISNLMSELEILNYYSMKQNTLTIINYHQTICSIQLYISKLKILFYDNKKVIKCLGDVSSDSTILLDHIKVMQEKIDFNTKVLHTFSDKLYCSSVKLSSELTSAINEKLKIITQSL